MRWLDSINNSVDMNLSKLWETVKDCHGLSWTVMKDCCHVAVHGVTKNQTQLSDSTTTTPGEPYSIYII